MKGSSMALPEKLQAKYLERFDSLIQEGVAIVASHRIESHVVHRDHSFIGPRSIEKKVRKYDEDAFFEWRSKCTTLLENLTRQGSVHTVWVDRFSKMHIDLITQALGHLRAMKKDFEEGFLDNLLIEVEAEVAGDYMGQAEQLLEEGQSGKYDHIPAAVLVGAVLEKSLRTLCSEQAQPIPTDKPDGKPKRLNSLIDDLKKAGLYTETQAKLLRSWAAIRNHAAHGEFDKFTKSDVELMISGVTNFLGTYLK